MRLSDYIEQSFTNLWKRKLRSFLTTFGVVIGIGALVAMISFGKGIQKNVTESFKELELFNYLTIFTDSALLRLGDPDIRQEEASDEGSKVVLGDKVIERIKGMKGVEAVFADIRFPASVRFNEKEEFVLIQVLPSELAASRLMKLRMGEPYVRDDDRSLIISDSLLSRMKVKDFSSALGEEIEISTLAFDFSRINPMDLSSFLRGETLPFARESYTFAITGIAERMSFGGPSPLRSDVFIPPGVSKDLKTLPFSNLWDLFRSPESQQGYTLVNVKVSFPRFIEPIKEEIQKMGLRSFAMIDQFEEFKTGFLFMDMVLAIVGMIALCVASLGIVNTMVMSILERYAEIGIMKAVGASDRDVKKIFFFESSVIGLLGGVFGLALGWIVSGLINQVVNYFLAKQGVPHIQYFNFPWWLCLGAVAFSITVSLLAGIYPALRAARVDPVVALRHD
jgi:putative ABC transport system permease protein